MRRSQWLLLALLGWAALVFWGFPLLFLGEAQRFVGYLLLSVSLVVPALFVRLLRAEVDALAIPVVVAYGRISMYFCFLSIAAAYPLLGLGDPRGLSWALTLFFPLGLGVLIAWNAEERTERPFGLTTALIARMVALGLLALLTLKWSQLRPDTALLLFAAIGVSLLGSRSVFLRPHPEGAQGAV